MIESVPELPLVLGDGVESVEKTSAAIKILKKVGAIADVDRAKRSHAIRAGKGKMRNRQYVSRKGLLIVHGTEGAKIVRAFRNLPGVEVASVDRLNLLKLAPGGHLGRFIIWTKSAFEKLDAVFGTFVKESLQKWYVLPRSKMVNSDLARIVNSDEIQSFVRPIQRDIKRKALKKNPLKYLGELLKLNPYAKTARRMVLLAEAERVKARQEKLDKKRKQPEVASNSSAERNWSTYGFIHSAKRNKLASQKAEDLVYVHSNLRLLSHKSEEYMRGPHKLWDILPETADLDAFAATLAQLSLFDGEDDIPLGVESGATESAASGSDVQKFEENLDDIF